MNLNYLSRFGLLIIFIIFMLLSSLGCQTLPTSNSNTLTQRPPRPLKTIYIGQTKLLVEVASTDKARKQGLSGRADLPEGTGMLFVFAEPNNYQFWMKDMRLALDFLWINQGGVVELTANVPPPTVSNREPVRLSSKQPIDMVIEVPAGWTARNQVMVGDKVLGLDTLDQP